MLLAYTTQSGKLFQWSTAAPDCNAVGLV